MTALPLPLEMPDPPRCRLSLVREGEPDYTGSDMLSSPDLVAGWLKDKIGHEPAEVLGAVYADTRRRAIGWAVLYRGTINRAAVEPRGILQVALGLNAANFILFHNHPSGDPTPSVENLTFTRRVADAGEVVGVTMTDHVIIASDGRWVSLRQRGGW